MIRGTRMPPSYKSLCIPSIRHCCWSNHAAPPFMLSVIGERDDGVVVNTCPFSFCNQFATWSSSIYHCCETAFVILCIVGTKPRCYLNRFNSLYTVVLRQIYPCISRCRIRAQSTPVRGIVVANTGRTVIPGQSFDKRQHTVLNQCWCIGTYIAVMFILLNENLSLLFQDIPIIIVQGVRISEKIRSFWWHLRRTRITQAPFAKHSCSVAFFLEQLLIGNIRFNSG